MPATLPQRSDTGQIRKGQTGGTLAFGRTPAANAGVGEAPHRARLSAQKEGGRRDAVTGGPVEKEGIELPARDRSHWRGRSPPSPPAPPAARRPNPPPLPLSPPPRPKSH